MEYNESNSFKGNKEEKIIKFLNYLNFDMTIFDDFIIGMKSFDSKKYAHFYKFINFNLKTNKVEFITEYLEGDVYPDNFNELVKWTSPELIKVANDLME